MLSKDFLSILDVRNNDVNSLVLKASNMKKCDVVPKNGYLNKWLTLH